LLLLVVVALGLACDFLGGKTFAENHPFLLNSLKELFKVLAVAVAAVLVVEDLRRLGASWNGLVALGPEFSRTSTGVGLAILQRLGIRRPIGADVSKDYMWAAPDLQRIHHAITETMSTVREACVDGDFVTRSREKVEVICRYLNCDSSTGSIREIEAAQKELSATLERLGLVVSTGTLWLVERLKLDLLELPTVCDSICATLSDLPTGEEMEASGVDLSNLYMDLLKISTLCSELLGLVKAVESEQRTGYPAPIAVR